MKVSYLKDLLRSGNSKLKKLCDSIHQILETIPNEDSLFLFAHLELRQLLGESFIHDKSFYREKINILNDNDTWTVFASRRVVLALLKDSGPELCVETS